MPDLSPQDQRDIFWCVCLIGIAMVGSLCLVIVGMLLDLVLLGKIALGAMAFALCLALATGLLAAWRTWE